MEIFFEDHVEIHGPFMIEKNEEGGDLDGRKKAKGSLCGSFGIFVAKIKYYLQQ